MNLLQTAEEIFCTSCFQWGLFLSSVHHTFVICFPDSSGFRQIMAIQHMTSEVHDSYGWFANDSMMLDLGFAKPTKLLQALSDWSNKTFKSTANFKRRNDGIKGNKTVHILVNKLLCQCSARQKSVFQMKSFMSEPFSCCF